MPPHEPSLGQPGEQLPPPGPESYDFIRQYGSKTTGTPLASLPTSKRVMIVGLGAALLVALAIGFMLLISKPNNPSLTLLVGVAQQENELTRVAKEASQDATQQPTLNFAMTMQYSLQTDQAGLLALLQAQGSSPTPQILSAAQSSATDTQLTAAKANGNYDQTYLTLAQGQLATYEQRLKQAFAAATSAAEKQWIQTAYSHAQLLVQMSSQTE